MGVNRKCDVFYPHAAAARTLYAILWDLDTVVRMPVVSPMYLSASPTRMATTWPFRRFSALSYLMRWFLRGFLQRSADTHAPQE